jgi:hypothetical protein
MPKYLLTDIKLTILWSGKITDDTGMLALVDPIAYKGFIDRDWTYDQIVERFREAMTLKQLLIWETGFEGIWRVRISDDDDRSGEAAQGFRSITGPIQTSGTLYLVNYETLSMVAQFEDERIDSPGKLRFCFTVKPDIYNVTIVQMFNPAAQTDDSPAVDPPAVDFNIYLQSASQTEAVAAPWNGIAWSRQ